MDFTSVCRHNVDFIWLKYRLFYNVSTILSSFFNIIVRPTFLRCVGIFLSFFLFFNFSKRRSFFSFNKFRPTVHPLVLTDNEHNCSSVKQSALPNGSATQMASAGDGDRVRIPLRAQISGAARRFGSGVSAFFSRLFGKDRENPKVAVREDPPAQRLVH